MRNSDNSRKTVLISIFFRISQSFKEDSNRIVYRFMKPEGILSITEVIFDPHLQSRCKIRCLLSDNGIKEVASFTPYPAAR